MQRIFSDNTELLKGRAVILHPLREEDREEIRPLAKDERLWEFTKTLIINDSFDQQFDQYFGEALALPGTIGGQAFVIRTVSEADLPAGSIIGMTRLFAIDWKDGRAEIGHTWYIPAVWGKVHNKECKLLLLEYLFEVCSFNRLEFRVAHQNLRSQKAVRKIGGVWEGELRKFTRRNDGSWRNTVIFSILIDEWPEKKAALQALVSGFEL